MQTKEYKQASLWIGGAKNSTTTAKKIGLDDATFFLNSNIQEMCPTAYV
jgi:hypothetical protein